MSLYLEDFSAYLEKLGKASLLYVLDEPIPCFEGDDKPASKLFTGQQAAKKERTFHALNDACRELNIPKLTNVKQAIYDALMTGVTRLPFGAGRKIDGELVDLM